MEDSPERPTDVNQAAWQIVRDATDENADEPEEERGEERDA